MMFRSTYFFWGSMDDSAETKNIEINASKSENKINSTSSIKEILE